MFYGGNWSFRFRDFCLRLNSIRIISSTQPPIIRFNLSGKQVIKSSYFAALLFRSFTVEVKMSCTSLRKDGTEGDREGTAKRRQSFKR